MIKKDKQKLVDAVIEEMKDDVNRHNDWTAIDSLLFNVDTKLLQGFLGDEVVFNKLERRGSRK